MYTDIAIDLLAKVGELEESFAVPWESKGMRRWNALRVFCRRRTNIREVDVF